MAAKFKTLVLKPHFLSAVPECLGILARDNLFGDIQADANVPLS